MKINRLIFVIGFISCITLITGLYCDPVFSQTIPRGQDAGAQERLFQDRIAEEEAAQRLQSAREALVSDASVDQDTVDHGPKVLIKKINVTGADSLDPVKINSIVSKYEGKELSLSDFRKIADLITFEYRKQGNVTSIAYLPPQKVSNNLLQIVVAEGRVGSIKIEGNKWFSEDLLRRYLDVQRDDLFNYDVLRENLNFVNENQDINTRVVLERGEDAGTTDVYLKVDDSFPLHATYGYSNYNSRFVERWKHMAELKATNFLGLGHIATAEMQLGEAERYQLYSVRYLAPLTSRHRLGLNYVHLNQRLGREVGDSEIKGKGNIWSLFYAYRLFDTQNFTMNITPGFEYKDIQNEVLGSVNSEDNVRIAKIGFDLDYTDNFRGRTIITQEFDFGLKDIFGGMSGGAVGSSRTGAGGDFFRSATNFARIQNLPYDLSVMTKGTIQLSDDNLVSSEQLFIGGPTTVRGYPVSEHGGDSGYNVLTELYIPPYGLSKDWMIPYTETSWYDSLRFLVFFDWGLVNTNDPQIGETAQEDIFSFGPAIRFNIPNRLSVSLDLGIQGGQDASDGSNSYGYLEVKLYL